MASDGKAGKGAGAAGRGAILLGATLGVFLLGRAAGLRPDQAVSSSIFVSIIVATLLFWGFRLAIAFLGIAALLVTRSLDLASLVRASELPVILFLVGMMVIVGVLKELGLFSWVIQKVIGMRKMDGWRFVVLAVLLSAILACAVDEVTSIVFMSALIFQVCDAVKVRPTPFLIISVMATNIGSTGTMLGNPVGILIGHKAGLSFIDFIASAFPVMLVCLSVSLAILLAWYRREIRTLSERLRARREAGLGLVPLVEIPYRRGLAILIATIVLIASHGQLETALGVEKNTILIVTPIAIAGVLMIWKRGRARHYIETEVEWWTLLFFLILFAVAGALEHTGVTGWAAERFVGAFGRDPAVLTPVVLFSSAIGSAFVDNIVLVAAFIPVVRELGAASLWWALLFGGCFGGNITLIGSTANIVAIGLLEKRYREQVRFGEWLEVGAVVGLVSCLIAWGAISILGGAGRSP